MNKNNPKLSIITVCYNNRNGLQKTMQSVVNQTFTDYEYIIIDGGSTDGTVDLIKANEQYIDYWVSEKDNGIYNAMNKGIKVANGEYCYFLNSDDCIAAPNTLEKIFDKVKNNPDIIYGNLAILKNEKLNSVAKYSSKITLYSFYRFKNAIHHQASFIKKDLFEKYGYYDEKIKLISDWVFFYQVIAQNSATTQYVNEVFAIFTAGGASYTYSLVDYNEAAQIKNKILETTNSPVIHQKMIRKKEKRHNKVFSIFNKIIGKWHLLLWLLTLKLYNFKHNENH